MWKETLDLALIILVLPLSRSLLSSSFVSLAEELWESQILLFKGSEFPFQCKAQIASNERRVFASLLARLGVRKVAEGTGGGKLVDGDLSHESEDRKTGSFERDVFFQRVRLPLRKEHFSFNERRINHRDEEMGT